APAGGPGDACPRPNYGGGRARAKHDDHQVVRSAVARPVASKAWSGSAGAGSLEYCIHERSCHLLRRRRVDVLGAKGFRFRPPWFADSARTVAGGKSIFVAARGAN